MQHGNKWNWAWTLLAIIVAFQTLTSLGINNLLDVAAPGMSHIWRKLASLPLIMWCLIVGYGVPCGAAIVMCCFKNMAAIKGYGIALLLSLPAVLINMIITLVLSSILPALPLVEPLAALVLPLTLLGLGVYHIPKSVSASAVAKNSSLSQGNQA